MEFCFVIKELSHYRKTPCFIIEMLQYSTKASFRAPHSIPGADPTHRPIDKSIRLKAEPIANWSEPLIFIHRGST